MVPTPPRSSNGHHPLLPCNAPSGFLKPRLRFWNNAGQEGKAAKGCTQALGRYRGGIRGGSKHHWPVLALTKLIGIPAATPLAYQQPSPFVGREELGQAEQRTSCTKKHLMHPCANFKGLAPPRAVREASTGSCAAQCLRAKLQRLKRSPSMEEERKSLARIHVSGLPLQLTAG